MTTETKVEAVAWQYRLTFGDDRSWRTALGSLNADYDRDRYEIRALVPASAITALEGEVERLRDTLTAIRQYGSDTLSGRADGGADDREWQRDAVREMTKRARVGLWIKLPGEE